MNTFTKMIDRLEDLVLTGTSIPFTPFTIINSEKLVPLMDRVRETLPDEIKQAHQLNEQREQILYDAQQRANQLLQDAKLQAERLLSDSELMRAIQLEADRVKQGLLIEADNIKRQAQQEAQAMRTQAYEETHRMRDRAENYASNVLGALDKSLMELHTVVRNGQKHLKKVKGDTPAATQPTAAPVKATSLQGGPHQGAPHQGVPHHGVQQGLDTLYPKSADPYQTAGGSAPSSSAMPPLVSVPYGDNGHQIDRLVTPEVARYEAARQALAPSQPRKSIEEFLKQTTL